MDQRVFQLEKYLRAVVANIIYCQHQEMVLNFLSTFFSEKQQ